MTTKVSSLASLLLKAGQSIGAKFTKLERNLRTRTNHVGPKGDLLVVVTTTPEGV